MLWLSSWTEQLVAARAPPYSEEVEFGGCLQVQGLRPGLSSLFLEILGKSFSLLCLSFQFPDM
jgi:hypothetical protein